MYDSINNNTDKIKEMQLSIRNKNLQLATLFVFLFCSHFTIGLTAIEE